ncbi:MAG: hypothetical protein LBH91_00985 [Prevotellaceae bacterium]|jgi:DNA-binding beta-propeller fold protein YncE|nr:hypothetical protein [Prevotellaceae bacterium]
MKTIKNIFLLAFMAVILNACLGDVTIPQYDDIVIVINEGNYLSRNGDISYYSETTKEVKNKVLTGANGITSLGAIIQSAEVFTNGGLYVVCNNDDKIEVFNATTGKVWMQPYTAHLSTPRYITAGGGRLYITNRGEGVDEDGSGWLVYPHAYVLVLQSDSWSKVTEIPCKDAEELFFHNIHNKLYVACREGVAVIDPNTNLVEKTLNNGLFGGAKSLAVAGGVLWASFPAEQKLLAINLTNDTVVDDYPMQIDEFSGKIATNGAKIYSFKSELNADWTPNKATIYEFDVNTKAAPIVFVEVTGAWFYSVGVSPFTGNVYTANVDFENNSLMLVYDSFRNEIARKEVGIGTCGFRFLSLVMQE